MSEHPKPVEEQPETGVFASAWLWRGLWALIGGLMLLLLFYEFFVL